jgi:hypothetical protein
MVHDLNRRALGGSEHLILRAGGVEHDGEGIVFPGAMEAGKTTLTAALVRAGLGYLTDEGVAVDRQTQRIHPYPKPFSIDRRSWPLFPVLEPKADLLTDAYKANQWQVSPADIRADALGQPCAIGVIVFPRHELGEGTSVETMAAPTRSSSWQKTRTSSTCRAVRRSTCSSRSSARDVVPADER